MTMSCSLIKVSGGYTEMTSGRSGDGAEVEG